MDTAHRPLIRGYASALLFAAFAVVAASSLGCGAGAEAEPPPTATPTVTPTPTPEPTPTLEEGERRRWGYDPWEPTGERDPEIPIEPLPAGYRIEKVVDGLNRPTQIGVVPDGRLFVTEQGGAVRVVENGVLLPEPVFSVTAYFPPSQEGEVIELGLTGIAVDPRFDENGNFYLYYEAANPRRTVLARVSEGAGEVLFIWQVPRPPMCCHIGGGMRFAPDGTLFIGVGEKEDPSRAQDPETVEGSVLRVNADGTIPADNPFANPVYAYGLRNPYDIAIDPETGRIFAGENGFFGQDAVVEVKRGANYGWPGIRLNIPESEVEPPLVFFHRVGGIAGMEFYSADALPEFTGRLYFCLFHTSNIHELQFNEDGSVARQVIRGSGCTTDIVTGADGFLYFLNYVEGALYRIVR